MQKLLWAVVALWLPLGVHAEVEWYGEIKTGMSVANVKAPHQQRFNRTRVDDFGSHIGLRGAEPLGNGMRAIWQFDTDMPLNSHSGSMREHFRRKKADSVWLPPTP